MEGGTTVPANDQTHIYIAAQYHYGVRYIKFALCVMSGGDGVLPGDNNVHWYRFDTTNFDVSDKITFSDCYGRHCKGFQLPRYADTTEQDRCVLIMTTTQYGLYNFMSNTCPITGFKWSLDLEEIDGVTVKVWDTDSELMPSLAWA